MLTSLHIQRYQGWHDQWCREVGAAFVKIVNPPENVDLLPSVPNVLVRFWSDDVAAGYIAREYEGGRAYVRDYAERFRRVRARGKVLELWNEQQRIYCVFKLEFMTIVLNGSFYQMNSLKRQKQS